MPQRRLLTSLAAASLLASAMAAQAAPALFGFEDLPVDAATPFTLGAGGLQATFSGPAGVDPGAFGVSYNSGSGPFPAPYRTLTTAFLTVGPAFGAAGSALLIAFSVPVSSISLLFALDDPAAATALSLVTSAGGVATAGGALSPGFRDPEGVLSFRGAPFSSVTLSSDALDFQIDDLAVTAAAAVPEPAGLATLAAGLALLAGARRRARG